MLLEIKTDERRQRYPGIEEKVFAVLDRHRVHALHGGDGLRGRDVAPAAPASPRRARGRALLGAHAAGRRGRSRELEALRQAGVSFVGLDQALVTAEVAKQARLAGLTLGVWTVNERDAIARFIDQGVGVVITDRPDLAKELLGR